MKKNFLILGASGMLGIELVKEFSKKKNISLYVTIRNVKDKKLITKYLGRNPKNIRWIKFEIKNQYFNKLKRITKNKDYIINCIGVIKPHIDESNILSVHNAINTNSIFPNQLNIASSANSQIFQIATDCVFDGSKGAYDENSLHTAKDLYGKSKSLGEVKSNNFFNIRCSIVGREIKNYKSLLCWFLNQKKNSTVVGFKNHLWSGVTTTFFAQVISTIIFKKIKIPNIVHIIPNKPVNKYQLLKFFQKKFNRQDLTINKVKSKITINRTLSTVYRNLNKKINLKMGKKNIPTIEKMIQEIY